MMIVLQRGGPAHTYVTVFFYVMLWVFVLFRFGWIAAMLPCSSPTC